MNRKGTVIQNDNGTICHDKQASAPYVRIDSRVLGQLCNKLHTVISDVTVGSCQTARWLNGPCLPSQDWLAVTGRL